MAKWLAAARRHWLAIAAIALAAVLIIALACAALNRNHGPTHYSARGAEARSKPYVASSAGEVYHRPGCRYARKISTDNLLGYDNPQDAQEDGKRPCKVCRPGD